MVGVLGEVLIRCWVVANCFIPSLYSQEVDEVHKLMDEGVLDHCATDSPHKALLRICGREGPRGRGQHYFQAFISKESVRPLVNNQGQAPQLGIIRHSTQW